MAGGIAAFLEASGLDPKHPELVQTPRRVARAWAREFLDGYRVSPAEAIGETYPAPEGSQGELVIVRNLRFRSMCPHHLLPYSGRAHLCYIPGKRVAGLGRLPVLLNCFAHRLILQEELARQVARSLAKELGSPGAACIIEASQSCLRLRGSHQWDAVVLSEAYEGRLRKDKSLRRALWLRLRTGKSR